MSEPVHGPDYRLVTFRRRGLGAAEIEHLSSLHAELLPQSPVVHLGSGFMRRFYYRFLPLDGHISGAIAYIDGEPAGFITAASDPARFMRAAFRKHWLRVCWLVGGSVLRAPVRLAAVKEAIQVDSGMAETPREVDVGELLSFGVLPRYREGSFVRRTGLRLSDDLLGAALSSLLEAGVGRVRAVVEADNYEAALFYQGRGWAPSGQEAKGWSADTVEYTVDLEQERDDSGTLIRSSGARE